MYSIKNLVVNGCSYTYGYSCGNGHIDLAKGLNLENAESLGIGGSANSRILRTTLKHSYLTQTPTLYVIGMTFISRYELPILKVEDETTSFEGRWCNPQNQEFSDRFEHFWNRKESEDFVYFKLKTEVFGLLDRLEDLMYQILSTIQSLQSRGHQALVFQQADNSYQYLLDNPRLQLFKNNNIIGGFKWCAIGYQNEQGVEKQPLTKANFIGPQTVPDHMRHPKVGHHQVLNDYLVDYIKKYNIV